MTDHGYPQPSHVLQQLAELVDEAVPVRYPEAADLYRSAFITGTDYRIDGGLLAAVPLVLPEQ